MLRRVTTFLSMVVMFLAAPALNVVFSTSAQAVDSCLARPTENTPHGSHWYYQTNRVTHQKCWVLGAKRAIVQNSALQKASGLQKDGEPTELVQAVSCINAPNSHAPQGKRWYYRVDKATGQRCWHLGTQVFKIGNSIPAQSPGRGELVAPETSVKSLPPAVADAQARFEDTSIALRNQIEMASSRAATITAEVADANLATSTFASRWINLSDLAHSSDPQSNLLGHSEIHQPVAAVLDEATNSIEASSHSYVERPPNVALIVLLGSLGSALVIFALIGRSFLCARPTLPVWPGITPRDDVFRIAVDLDALGPTSAISDLAGRCGRKYG